MALFTTNGPVQAEHHLAIPPLDRIDGNALLTDLQEQGFLFCFAPPGYGVTSLLLALRGEWLDSPHDHDWLGDPLYLDLTSAAQPGQPLEDRVLAVMTEIGLRARCDLEEPEPLNWIEEVFGVHGPVASIRTLLQRWLRLRKTPLTLMIDGLQGCDAHALQVFLQQLAPLHDTFGDGPEHRLLVAAHGGYEALFPDGCPPFLNRTHWFQLPAFSVGQVQQLAELFRVQQNRAFNREAVDLIWQLTQGHPWLVGSLMEQTAKVAENENPISGEHVAEAKERLIAGSHSPLKRRRGDLNRPGVQRVIEPLLAASPPSTYINARELEEARATGLIADDLPIRFANRLFEEWVPRALVHGNNDTLQRHAESFFAEGRLQTDSLLRFCQMWFAGPGRGLLTTFPYRQSGYLLLLQGLILRLLEDRGRIERECDPAKQLVTLFVFLQVPEGIQTVIIGLKWQDPLNREPLHRQVSQISHYMTMCETQEGHLVILPPNDHAVQNAPSQTYSLEPVDDLTVHCWGF